MAQLGNETISLTNETISDAHRTILLFILKFLIGWTGG